MIDEDLKPWLIEINQSPSFATDSPLDLSIKQKLMEDTFILLNMSPERKAVYMEEGEKEYYERLMLPYRTPKLNKQEKHEKRMALDRGRQIEENNILGNGSSGYEQIFPVQDDDTLNRKYNKLIKLSQDLQNEFTMGKVRVVFEEPKKVEELPPEPE